MLHCLSLEFSINNSKIKIESEIPKEFDFWVIHNLELFFLILLIIIIKRSVLKIK
jgi:hypothetical protein